MIVVGPVDILINCAGISQTTLLKRTPDAEIGSIVDTNLLATMLVCKYAKVQPHGMIYCEGIYIYASTDANKGCIINVSSLMATKGAIGATAYAASKAGVVGTSTFFTTLSPSRPLSFCSLPRRATHNAITAHVPLSLLEAGY
jgi:NAD(P)-dependent dehydrogenase (short-subunit alcohol dehydrogenase family)